MIGFLPDHLGDALPRIDEWGGEAFHRSVLTKPSYHTILLVSSPLCDYFSETASPGLLAAATANLNKDRRFCPLHTNRLWDRHPFCVTMGAMEAVLAHAADREQPIE
jgi:hypothetical protein